ncbi:hypothetical protein LINGRAPRIM_LOCUS2894, partial [Linum grandiflorum]
NNLIAYRAKGHRIKKLLYEAGFSGFLKLQNKQHNWDLIDTLLKSFDPLSKTFIIGGTRLVVTASDVERVYGLPSAGLEVDIQTAPPKHVPTFKNQVSLSMQQGVLISFRQLKDKLASTSGSTAFAKLYILLCIGELLAPRNSDNMSLKYGAYLKGEFTSIKTYNWSQHVLDISLAGLSEWHVSRKVHLSDDINFLIVSDVNIFHCHLVFGRGLFHLTDVVIALHGACRCTY